MLKRLACLLGALTLACPWIRDLSTTSGLMNLHQAGSAMVKNLKEHSP